MARILVASLPFAGHVGPLSALAGELVRRGHQVVAYTGAKYEQRYVDAGASWLPWTKATDFDDADLAATFPEIGNGKGMRGDRANIEYVLFGTSAGQVADVLAAAPFDLIVTDQTAFGVAVAAEKLGMPWATVAVTPLSLLSKDAPQIGSPFRPSAGPVGRARDALLRGLTGVIYRRYVDPRLNKIRASAGLGPVPVSGRLFDTLYSPHLVLAQGVPGLDYLRGDLPSHVQYVGRLAAAATGVPAPLPDWWGDLDDAPTVVHVTQGTLDTDLNDLLKPALAGLAAESALVVCTTGGASPSELGTLPANARVAPFLPHDKLLPLVDVMVTNGGWGGVLAAVQAGVPLVVAGASLDKPEVARRVAWSGAGVNLSTGQPSATKVRDGVRTVLGQPEMRARARSLGAALTAAGGVTRGADLVEALL